MVSLLSLIHKFPYSCIKGNPDTEVTGVVFDSRKVERDCLFICIKGAAADGHSFAAAAVKSGAKVIITEKDLDIADEVTVIKVENTRYALALISAAYFNYPSERLKVIGITGTKGKTTTTYMIKSILENAGHKVGLIGTIEVMIGDQTVKAGNTTPESYYLQKYLSEMVNAGCDTVVMEVSSQGLMLCRTAGILFDIGIFTNIEPDHIGPNEHADFDEYLACKRLLFQQCRLGIINRDDRHWEDIIRNHTCDIITYGFSEGADLKAENMELIAERGSLSVKFQVKGIENMAVEVDIPGKFSVYNSLAAIAVCHHFKIAEENVKEALKDAKVKGRIELIDVPQEYTLMIDYAHNAMSLKSLLSTLKEYHPERLICLFGCGGNRSKLRRYEMGEVAGSLADLTVITSDNPRFENPQDIINDIKTGIKRTAGKYIEICDRREAIRYVMEHGQKGDIIVLAGKGHEDYQEIEGVKYPMDERDIIKDILNSRV